MRNELREENTKKYKEIVEMAIREFLRDNFNGNENAIPSIIVKGIAEKIYDIRYNIYDLVQIEVDIRRLSLFYEYKKNRRRNR